jgi:hypothetical protein
MCGFLLTPGTMGRVRQARKRCGVGGALAARRDGLGWLCLGRHVAAGPGEVQHDKQPQESQDHELIVKLMWNHGKKPPHNGMIGGHCTRFLGRDNYPQRRGTRPDGDTLTFLKQQRHVDVIVPVKSTMLSYTEAVQLAELQDAWPPHPARDHQHIACVKGVEHLWDACQVPLNACVLRYGNRKKAAWDPSVLVTTDQRLTGPWIVRHYEERPEIEQDYEQRKSGGWQLQKLSATRDSEIVFYIATGVLSYSLYPLFSNTQAGARFADKTRQALAFEQLRS